MGTLYGTTVQVPLGVLEVRVLEQFFLCKTIEWREKCLDAINVCPITDRN